MKSKNNNKSKNKKVNKSRSKKGAGLFNTQKILELPGCGRVKNSNYRDLTSEDAFLLYNKCCPKASLSGKANSNFYCQELYKAYLNNQSILKNQPLENHMLNQKYGINNDLDYNNKFGFNNDNYNYNTNNSDDIIKNQFIDALIQEQSKEQIQKFQNEIDHYNAPIKKEKKWWRFGFGGKKNYKTKKILRKNIKKKC
jgi:hypothetical protein